MYERRGTDADSVLEEVLRNDDESRRWLEPYHRIFADNYRFLYKFEHYDDWNANERDRRRAKPRGRQLAAKHRHKVAQILKQSLYVSTRPVDDETDPAAAEDVRWFLEYEVNDPRKRFKRVLRRAVSLMLATSAGAIGLKVHYDLGPYPEVRPYLMDPRDVRWTPGWQDPDDDTCPYVIFEETWRISAIEAMKDYGWKNTAGLHDDNVVAGVGGGRVQDSSRPVLDLASANAAPSTVELKDRVRVLFCWYRFDHSTQTRDTQKVRELEPSQRYMACPQCGFTDRSQDGALLPEQGDVCPECFKLGSASMMGRVSREQITEEVLRYARGKRLVIVAPDQRRVFYDGPWPYDIGGRPMRNVPVAFLKSYDIPLEPWGSCDTEWDWSYQVISNALERRNYEFLSRAGGIIIAGMDGLYDASGTRPFEFTDRPISLARWKGMGQPAVSFFEPRGMVGESMPYMQYLNNQFRADMGTSDLGLTPSQSKDIPVGTVRQLVESGEVPVDDHGDQVRDALSSLYGVWYDMKRAIMTERQMVRLKNEMGAEIMAKLRGEELPNVDVIVGSGPSWSSYDAERIEKLRFLLAPMPGVDPMVWPRLWPLLAEVANVPQETVQKLQRVLAPPAAPAGAPPDGFPVPAPGMAEAGAPAGNGIPAAIQQRMALSGGMGLPGEQGA